MKLVRVIFLVSAGLAVAGCGADGEPVQPTLNANVGIGSSGGYASAGVGVSNGPLSIYLGL